MGFPEIQEVLPYADPPSQALAHGPSAAIVKPCGLDPENSTCSDVFLTSLLFVDDYALPANFLHGWPLNVQGSRHVRSKQLVAFFMLQEGGVVGCSVSAGRRYMRGTACSAKRALSSSARGGRRVSTAAAATMISRRAMGDGVVGGGSLWSSLEPLAARGRGC